MEETNDKRRALRLISVTTTAEPRRAYQREEVQSFSESLCHLRRV